MSIEIKIYLTPEQNYGNLCFHAVVNSQDDYDIFFDLNETYEVLMIEALQGEFSINHIDKDSLNKHKISIQGDDYAENIHSFVSFLNDFYGLTAVTSEFDLYQHVGVRLVGAGFRGNPDNPMLEQAQFAAMHSIHGIKTSLFKPVNNVDYTNDDIYIKKAPGSLKLTLEATKKYEEPIAFMQEIYNDIENCEINPFKYTDVNRRERYQSIIKNLNDLNSQKRLKEFYIIIDNIEYPITQRKYLKEQTKSIYFEDIELIGIYEGYKKSSNSFEITIDNYGRYYCHLDPLSRDDAEQFANVYRKLSTINIFSNRTRIKIMGQRVKPKTINIMDVEVLQ